MLDVIILAETEIKEEAKVNMITWLLWEKIQDLLVEDQTNIIQLIIHQAFPLKLADILVQKVESFHVAIGFISDFLMRSLNDLEPIFQEDTDDDKSDSPKLGLPTKKDKVMVLSNPYDHETNQFDLLPEHYRLIYRTVFFYRILARLSEKYVLQDLQEKARRFIVQVYSIFHILGYSRFTWWKI